MNQEFYLIGYQIDKSYFYNIGNRTLLNVSENPSKVIFRRTMAVLFEYLLEHAQGKVVTDNEIMANVWEANDLKASSQRLWQVMDNLKSALQCVGINEDLIMRVNSNGYLIRGDLIFNLYTDLD